MKPAPPHEEPTYTRTLLRAVQFVRGLRADHPEMEREELLQLAERELAQAFDIVLTHNRPGRSGEPWTHEEDARLRARYRPGVSLQALAVEHMREPDQLRHRLKKLGLR